MTLIQKLQRAARKYDECVKWSLHNGSYNFEAADMRELLEEAAKALRAFDTPQARLDRTVLR